MADSLRQKKRNSICTHLRLVRTGTLYVPFYRMASQQSKGHKLAILELKSHVLCEQLFLSQNYAKVTSRS